MSINRTLSDEILNEIENLSREEIGSDKYKANVDAIAKLLDRKIELEKLEFEKIDKEKSREADINIKLSQIEDNKKERYWKYGVAIGTFVGGAVVSSLAFIASTNFEREGTFTTEGGRNAIRELLKIRR